MPPESLLLNPEAVSDETAASFRTREAVRAVLTDAEGRVALLKVGKLGHFKLPGGGVEAGEGLATALARECLEETDCAITIGAQFATTEEWRAMHSLRQLSSGFLAQVQGPKGVPEFDQGEAALNFSLHWFAPAAALQQLQNSAPQDTEGQLYIVPRDIWLLQQGLQVISGKAI
jgi:8-oxo-dGTP diphosphatase